MDRAYRGCPSPTAPRDWPARANPDAARGRRPLHQRPLSPGAGAAYPPICADVGLALITTKAVQIWESCAHEAHAGRAAVGVTEADRLPRAVASGQRDRYQATVRWTASRCGVGSRWPKAASNLVASMTKGPRNW